MVETLLPATTEVQPGDISSRLCCFPNHNQVVFVPKPLAKNKHSITNLNKQINNKQTYSSNIKKP